MLHQQIKLPEQHPEYPTYSNQPVGSGVSGARTTSSLLCNSSKHPSGAVKAIM